MDEMNSNEQSEVFDVAPIESMGGLPDAVRARVRRRRVAHRVKTGVGTLAGVAVCVLFVAVLMRPSGGGLDERAPSWGEGAVIGIDDPIFDAMDQGDGIGRVDTRWRAGARLDVDWVLEM